MQARYYDPVIGRFYSNDPVGFRDVHSFNRYAYANNNPYKYVDPDGEFPILGALFGAGLEVTAQLIASGGDFSQLTNAGNLARIAAAGVAGAIGVGLGKGVASISTALTSRIATSGAVRIGTNVSLNTAGNAVAGAGISVTQNATNNIIDGKSGASILGGSGSAAVIGSLTGASGSLVEGGFNAVVKGAQSLANATGSTIIDNVGTATLPGTSTRVATGSGIAVSNVGSAVQEAHCQATSDSGC
jgi:uncharacterized protein RhaS with RHS repeats